MRIKLLIFFILSTPCISGMDDELISISSVSTPGFCESIPWLDNLNPITSYDPMSPAVLPPSWWGKPYETIDDVLKPFPALINYCWHHKQSPYLGFSYTDIRCLREFLLGNEIPKSTMLSIAQNASTALDLSPQTHYFLSQAFLHLMHGTALRTDDARLAYDEDRELNNKLYLINKLPILLRDLVCKSEQKEVVSDLISPLISTFGILITDKQFKKGMNALHKLIYQHNDNPTWCIKTISPQTACFGLAEQYKNFVQKNTPFTDWVYDVKREQQHFRIIMNFFPPELKITVDDRHEKAVWRLAYFTHWLRTDNWQHLLVGNNMEPQSLLRDLKSHLLSICKKNDTTEYYPNNNLKPYYDLPFVERVTRYFLHEVGPITWCKNLLMHKISSIRRKVDFIDETLEETISVNAQKLREKYQNVNELKNLSFQTLTEELQNGITCPICLEFFKDIAPYDTHGGLYTAIMPCKHAVCSTCSFMLTPTCPLCRGAVQSTISAQKD